MLNPSMAMVEVGRAKLPERDGADYDHARVTMHVHGDYAYLGDYSTIQLWIYNVSNKTSPHLVSTLQLPSNNLHDIWYADGYVYTGHRFGGINMINVTDPGSPVIVDYRNDGYIHKGLITTRDGKYLLSGKGVTIYDISDGNLGAPIGNANVAPDGFEVVVTSDDRYAYRCTSFSEGSPLASMILRILLIPTKLEHSTQDQASYLHGRWRYPQTEGIYTPRCSILQVGARDSKYLI